MCLEEEIQHYSYTQEFNSGGGCYVVICHRFPQSHFEYQDPTTNFDRSRVKGPVVRLLRVRERGAATALEVTAGGRVSGWGSQLWGMKMGVEVGGSEYTDS